MKCLYSETGLNGVLLTNGQLVSFNPKSVINKILQNYQFFRTRFEKYYDCGYGCQLYNYDPGCTVC